MRRLLVRKKRTFLLFCMPFLLVGGVAAFRMFGEEREYFVHHMHDLVEKKLSASSGLQVRVGKLGMGFFQETVLEDLSFALPGERPFGILPVARFRKEGAVTKIKFEKGTVSWKGMILDHLEGRIVLEPDDPFLGPASSFQKGLIQGEFRKGGWVKISLEKRNPLVLKGEVVLQNFLWGQKRLSGIGGVVLFIRDRRDPWKRPAIKMAWRHLTLDDKPIEAVLGCLSLEEKTLLIESLQWGNLFSFSGKVGLSSPCPVEGRLSFQNLRREDIQRFLKKDYPGTLPRFMEGQIFLSGPLKKIHLRGNLVAHEGRIKDTDYQKILSTFYGRWPVVTVESRIEREFPKESSATVRGLVDLGELGKKGFYKTVALEGADAMVWKGVVFKNPSEETLVLGKEGRNSSVTFKTFLNQVLPQEKEEEEFELEYRLQNDKSLKMRLKGDETFMGLERKTSF